MMPMSYARAAVAAMAAPQALRNPSSPVRASSIPALVDALTSETRLLDELVAVMQSQRAAVAADDLPAVDTSVFATHRILFTLGEARKRRRSLNRLICDADELPLRELDEVLGEFVTDELRAARDALHAAARVLAHEVEVNRQVLRRALATSDEYVRSLYGGPEALTGYSGRPLAEGERRGGVLLNRTA